MNTIPFRSAIGCALAVAALGSAVSLAADETGWVSLFDGHDLARWRPANVAADTFSVRDGMIVASGRPQGFMRSDRQYENFEIELEWQHMKEGGNSGLFVWGDGLPAPGAVFPKAIEVQILDPGYDRLHPRKPNSGITTQGDVFPIRGATMTPSGRFVPGGKRSLPIEDRTRPSPEWNRYRVVCNNGEIRLSVNGREVTVGKNAVPRKGYIGLESEDGEVHFRNIRIRELPSTGATGAETANAFEGFRALFDGHGFGGWKTTPDVLKVWSVRGATFTARDRVAGRNLDLWTDRSYRDFELCVDWRLTSAPSMRSRATFTPDGLYVRDDKGKVIRKEILDAGDSGIYLRGSSRYQVNIWSQPMGSGDINELHRDPSVPEAVRRASLPSVAADLAPGKWNRFLITLRGDRVTVVLNGKMVIDSAPLPGIAAEGPIGLQYHHDGVEFTNVFVRELAETKD